MTAVHRHLPTYEPNRTSRGDHAHLWQLPDGTGLHAPFGTLVRSEDGGAVCCHLCGRWFRHLGAHVRVHGLTTADYRETFGLLRSGPLSAAEVSQRIARRQRAAYAADPELRERLAEGQALARSGRLTWLARRSYVGPERAASRAEQLAAGRATRSARRDAALATVLAEHGVADLHDLLREQYALGASLETLARRTGLGRTRLRREVAAAGIDVRPSGATTHAGRRSRAATAEAQAAALVGTDDLVRWLRDRRAEGWSLTRLGRAVGHSTHWVRWRLED